MMDHKEAYRYTNYIQNLHGSKINIVPPMTFITDNTPHSTTPSLYSMASLFMESANNKESSGGFDDFFKQKKELSEDSVNLVLGDIYLRENIKNKNLDLLYEDLLLINNWRLERPFPDFYSKDKIWSNLNQSELKIREQIRREMKDAAHDILFTQKDLRGSLLEFKLQAQKNQLLDGDLEMELDSSYPTATGDLYSKRQTS